MLKSLNDKLILLTGSLFWFLCAQLIMGNDKFGLTDSNVYSGFELFIFYGLAVIIPLLLYFFYYKKRKELDEKEGFIDIVKVIIVFIVVSAVILMAGNYALATYSNCFGSGPCPYCCPFK